MTDAIGMNQLLGQMRAIRQASGSQLENIQARQADRIEDRVIGSNPASFSTVLQRSVDAVNETQHTSAAKAAAFERGAPDVTLPEVMVAMQKSSVSFTAAVEVRNKLIDAYQEVMRMSV